MSVERVGEDAIELAEDGMIVADRKHCVLVVALVVRKPEQPIADHRSAGAGPALTPGKKRRVRQLRIAAQPRVGGEMMIPEIRERRPMERVGAAPRHDVYRAGPR